MIKKLLFAAITIALSVSSQAQVSGSFDSTSVTIDTDGKIIEVDGAPFDLTTNPLKVTFIGLGTADLATKVNERVFTGVRSGYTPPDNNDGSGEVNGTLHTNSPGTIFASDGDAGGTVSFDIDKTNFPNNAATSAITVGQTGLQIVSRMKVSNGPSTFRSAVLNNVTVVLPGTLSNNFIKKLDANISASNGTISVEGANLDAVYTITGQQVAATGLASGIYIVKISKGNASEIVKIVLD
ncbi:hypothetical protein ACXGQW_05190 [Wenyingzhuangia sp. IMCC45533]